MNLAVLMGRVCTEPIVNTYKKENKEEKYARFLLSVPDEYDRKKSDFLMVKCFGEKRAIFVSNYIKLGSRIVVKGRISSKRYEKNGITDYSTEIIAEKLYFADKLWNTENSISEEEMNMLPIE